MDLTRGIEGPEKRPSSTKTLFNISQIRSLALTIIPLSRRYGISPVDRAVFLRVFINFHLPEVVASLPNASLSCPSSLCLIMLFTLFLWRLNIAKSSGEPESLSCLSAWSLSCETDLISSVYQFLSVLRRPSFEYTSTYGECWSSTLDTILLNVSNTIEY